MAISDIPLNWEMLALVGTACACAAAGAWIVGRASSQSEARALKVENDFLKLRLSLAEADIDKYKAGLQAVQERLIELSGKYATLLSNLKTTTSGTPNAQGAQQSLQLMGELQTRIERYSALQEAVVAGTEEDVWNLLEKIAPEDFERRMRDSKLRILMVANLKRGSRQDNTGSKLGGVLCKEAREARSGH